MSKKTTPPTTRKNRFLRHTLLSKPASLIHEDLSAIYARDLRKWLIIAPIIGLIVGLVITGVVVIILGKMWPPVLSYYLGHHWAIIPGLVLGFIVTGLIMQFLTANPDEPQRITSMQRRDFL